MRLFIGIEIPVQALEELIEFKKGLAEAIQKQGVRMVADAKLHLTLLFLGEVSSERVDDLISVLGSLRQETFSLRLSGVGGFPSADRPRVVWTGVDGEIDSLRELQRGIAEAAKDFGDSREESDYTPHVTLARVSPGSRIVGRAIKGLSFESHSPFQVSQFAIYHSRPDGTYEVISRFPLA